MTSIFKNFIIITVLTGTLYGLGTAIDALFPWSWLTTFFVLLRQLVMPFNFFWDIDTMFSLVSISLAIEAIFWTVKSLISVVNLSGLNKN